MGIKLHRHESNRYSKFATVKCGQVTSRKIGQVEIKGQRLTVCEKNLSDRSRFSARDLAGNVIYRGFLKFDDRTLQFSDNQNFVVAHFDLETLEPVFPLQREGM